ncbi:PREDICTED: putative glucan endo-1,3-beta-glucosidase GVI [Prunus mume]|nr:PREDICTED: putative glucan endo-1,3-beta-glucosidase GVI [Prunus mume]
MQHSILYSVVAFMLLVTELQSYAGAQGIGANYGRQGDNLPTPDKVIQLCKSRNIQRIRIFDPQQDVLQALQGSGIQVIIGTLNIDVPTLANDPAFATTWLQTNIIPFASSVNFRCISVGNEMVPSQNASSILPAMQNLRTALIAANLNIPISTAVFQNVLASPFPPSAGIWHPDAASIMVPLVQYMQANGYPLLYNAYPYFAYHDNPNDIRLDYALMSTSEVIVTDGALGYTNLLDASLDALYWALEKVGAPNVEIVVAETGWPSEGEGHDQATIDNARTYNSNLIKHGQFGTPKRPGKGLEAYIFALFNEDLKPKGSESHWGLFYPDMSEVYHVDF